MTTEAMQALAAAFGLVFAAAAGGKVVGFAGWEELTRRLTGNDRLAAAAGLGLPLLEAAVAVFCFAQPAIGLAGAAALLAGFAVTLVAFRERLAGAGCNCFGPLFHSRVGPALVIRNSLLAVAAAAAAAANPKTPGLRETVVAVAVLALGALGAKALAWRPQPLPTHGELHTRRDVLIAFAQGVALLALPSFASAGVGRTRSPHRTVISLSPQRSSTKPDITNDPRNTSRSRHCDKFADLVDRGVYAEGKYQGFGHTGYTAADGLEDDSPGGWKKAHAGVCKQVESRIDEWRGHCPCDNKVYYKESLCKTECPKGLKCFGIQCVTDYRRVCLEAMVDVCVSVPKITVSVLRWKPGKKSKAACRQTASDFNEQNMAHELRHVSDINRSVDDVNDEFKNQSVRGCGATEAEARAALNANIEKLKDQARRRLWDLDHDRSDQLHRSEPSPPLDCRPCP